MIWPPSFQLYFQQSHRFCMFAAVCVCLFCSQFLHADENASSNASQHEFFENRIRPVLIEHCYECHNSTGEKEGGLTLDWQGGMQQGGDSAENLLETDTKNNWLLQIIRHEVPGLEMPEGSEKLPDRVIRDFERWIACGAHDPRDQIPTTEKTAAELSWEAKFAKRKQWWSLQPIIDPAIPDHNLLKHPVDRYLEQARWAKFQYEDAAEAQLLDQSRSRVVSQLADRWTILRRLHYVLTGLPATDQEMSEFNTLWESEGREVTVRKTADKLIQSPHFGERWAQHWLDWFRYSEGHGGQGDPTNEDAHEYRDYIIRALNANVPYDRLIQEHIAGDLIEERLDPSGMLNESVIGLAQFRFVEHGFFPVDALDELIKFTDNQIDVVCKATLGLTVSCARCHDHKFDPISQKDYHALFGIFASSRPARRPILASSIIESKRSELMERQQQIAATIKSNWLETLDPRELRNKLDRFAELHAKLEANPKASVQTLAGEETIFVAQLVRPGDALEPWIRWTNEDQIRQRWQQWSPTIDRLKQSAMQHNAEITVNRYDFRDGLPSGWRVTDGTVIPVPAGFIGFATDDENAVQSILPAGMITHSATAHEQAAIFSPDFVVDFGGIAADWSGSGWSLFRLVPQNFPRGGGGIYRQNDARNDGLTRWFSEETDFWSGNRAYFHFQTRGTASAPPVGPRGNNGKPVNTKANSQGSWFHVREVRQLRNEKDRIQTTEFAASALLSAAQIPNSRDELAATYYQAIRQTVNRWQTDQFTDEDALFLTECLKAGLLNSRADQLGSHFQQELAELRKIESNFVALARRATPAVVESAGFDQPLYTRGNHQQPGERVSRAFLSVLDANPFDLSNETGRLQLANALTADDNPLLARVIANRIWQHVFGRGIVGTPDNLGQTGQLPTHPELLDHLASRMQRTGYDLQDAIRYLVTTELFQLSSVSINHIASVDPNNLLWTHADIRRFDAEVVRDHLLSLSGQMEARLFGPSLVPSVNPPQDRRRGLYVARKRKGRNEFLDAFDMPIPSTTRGARDVTTTPAQAITMLNSPFVRFQAEKWAEAQQNYAPAESLEKLVRLAFTRPVDSAELSYILEFYAASGASKNGLIETAHLIFNCKEMIYLP